MLQFACSDVGFDCGFKAEANTEQELWSKIGNHAKTGHNLDPSQIPADLKAKIQSKIKRS